MRQQNVRRVTGILLIGVLLALGSGALRHVHHHAHTDDVEHHDEAHCLLHALTRAAVMLDGHVPVLVCAGLFVAFLTMLASQPATLKVFTRLDCRGPPARLLISV